MHSHHLSDAPTCCSSSASPQTTVTAMTTTMFATTRWTLLLLPLATPAWGLSSSSVSHRIITKTEAIDPPCDTSFYDWPKITGTILKGERRAIERATGLREVCGGCHRPHTLCLCPHLPSPKLSTQTSILILQHPNERRKRNLSTTPLLQLALQNCVVKKKVGYDFDESIIQKFPAKQPLLLYPSETAIVLDEDDCENDASACAAKTFRRADKDKNLLILMDGTWGEAKRMMRQSPKLVERCQKMCFQSVDETSMYDVLRREPQAHCLSTLEACSKALGYLEPSSGNSVQSTLHNLLQAHVHAHLVHKRKMEQLPRYVNRSGGGMHTIQTRQEMIQERMALEKLRQV